MPALMTRGRLIRARGKSDDRERQGHRNQPSLRGQPAEHERNESRATTPIEIRRLRDLSPRAMEVGARGLAGLAVRRPGHAPLHAGRRPVRRRAAGASPTRATRAWAGTARWIQAAFLLGWALGGGFFGRLGDRLGRSRALSLTILTYALFTGLSSFAQTWWHLLIFRFLAALGIGGEWAVGASLLSETWPRRWRPWIAAVLQTGVNVGVLLASVADVPAGRLEPPRGLPGRRPARLLVFWIRREVPEPEEWHAARADGRGRRPRRSPTCSAAEVRRPDRAARSSSAPSR